MDNLLKDKPLPTGQVLENIGYSPGIAATPNMVLDTEGFHTALTESGLKGALIKRGITPEKIADKINVLLEAKKPIKQFSHETGETELLGERDDYQAIDKGLTHATKIYGILDDTPKEKSGNTYNFMFSADVREKVQVIEAEIKDMLTKPHVQEN